MEQLIAYLISQKLDDNDKLGRSEIKQVENIHVSELSSLYLLMKAKLWNTNSP